MLFTHLTHAMTALADVLAQNQRRLVDAQLDVCRQWVEACRPPQTAPKPNPANDGPLDGPLQATQSLLIAQVQAGNDLMMLSERLVSSLNRELVKQLNQAPMTRPSRDALESAVAVGGCAYESMSKATRQVNQFACTNLSAASLRAVKHARQHLGSRHH